MKGIVVSLQPNKIYITVTYARQLLGIILLEELLGEI